MIGYRIYTQKQLKKMITDLPNSIEREMKEYMNNSYKNIETGF